MPINETLSHYSDLAFGSAFAVYLLALTLLVAHFAATRPSTLRPTEGEMILVGAGGSPTQTGIPGRVIEAPRRSRRERLGRMGVSLIILGWGLHLTSITLRGVATDRAPWGNMYEFVTLACAAGIGASLLMLRKPVLRPMWVFVLTPVLILMFIAGTLLYATAAPVVPALQSYWLLIHVSIVSVGSGVFLIPGWPACCSSFESATPTALPAVVASGSSRNGCRTRRSWIGWPTGQRSSRSHCSVRASSSAPSGQKPRGAGFGMGPQRDHLLHRLDRLRRLPARPRHRRLAGNQGRLDQHRRIRRHAGQPVHHQHRGLRPALLRRAQLDRTGAPACANA